MFAPYCEAHGSRVLLSMSSITAIETGEDGLVAHFVCSCGTEGTWVAG
ncbi:MAG TPA: hypothetical protein VJ948_09360 [Acidimicrobiia bacterium]|nr:hypothetical protein [Acidimicrobiia bacterium]